MLNLKDVIKNEVAVMVSNETIFTAYEITKILRQKNPNENIRHQDVKTCLYDMFDEDEDCLIGNFDIKYCCTSTKIKSDSNEVWANVFHPNTISNTNHPLAVSDDYDYDLDDGKDEDDIENDNDATVVVSTTHYTEICYPDKDGRINIPQTLLKKANIEAGSAIKVSISNDKKHIVIDAPLGSGNFDLFCNADGRVRINKQTLSQLEQSSVKHYVAGVKDNAVVVTIPS